MKHKILTLLALAGCLQMQAQPFSPDSAAYESRMNWFGKAKLGIFIHWGIYAVKGISESWSFGIGSVFLWMPQWYKDPSYNFDGLFLTASVSARYHF